MIRQALLKYDLWNQLSIDRVQKLALWLFIQGLLKNYHQSRKRNLREK